MAKKLSAQSVNSLKTYASAAAITLLCGGLVAAMVFGNSSLDRRASAVLDPHEVIIDMVWPAARAEADSQAAADKTPRTWMPLACREQILSLAKTAASPSSDLLKAEQLSRISKALEQSGWFAKLPLITRKPGGVIRVDGQWRIPAANVRHANQSYLISWDGRPMPTGVETSLSIFDPAVGPPRDSTGDRDFTRPWGGEDVAACLELLSKLSVQPWLGQVQGIDASQYAKSGTLIIVTDNNTKVVWGGRPSKPALGEVSTSQKLEHLRQLVKDTKRIDANYPLIYINQERLQFDISATATAIRLPEELAAKIADSEDDAGR